MTSFNARGVLYSFLTITTLFFFSKCSEDPSSVGNFLLPVDIRVASLPLSTDSTATYRAPISGASTTLLLGISQTTVESRLLLQFEIPQGFPDTLVASASLKLKPRYWFRDSLGTLAFTVHKILIPWDEFKITFADTTGLFDPTVRGSDSRSMSPRETLLVPIDTSLVREWLRSPSLSYGVFLKPTTASSVVYGFTSILDLFTDDRPELIVRYTVPDTTRRLDSLILRTSQNAFVANAPQAPPSSDIVFIQAGVADRGLMHFSVDSIPSSASITSASLEFRRNSALSVRNELSIDSILVQILLGPDSLGGTSARADPSPSENDSVFTSDIRNIVQQWVIGKPNYGVALRAFGEFSTLDRFAVHGRTSPDTASRPVLRITYSVLK